LKKDPDIIKAAK